MYAHLQWKQIHYHTAWFCIIYESETQSLTTVTLGTPLDELLVESAANRIIRNSFSIIIFRHSQPRSEDDESLAEEKSVMAPWPCVHSDK